MGDMGDMGGRGGVSVLRCGSPLVLSLRDGGGAGSCPGGTEPSGAGGAASTADGWPRKGGKRSRPIATRPAPPPGAHRPPASRRAGAQPRRPAPPRGDGPESLTVLQRRCGHVQYSAWQYQLSTKTPLPTPLTPQPATRSQDHVPSWSDMHAYCEHLHWAARRLPGVGTAGRAAPPCAPPLHPPPPPR